METLIDAIDAGIRVTTHGRAWCDPGTFRWFAFGLWCEGPTPAPARKRASECINWAERNRRVKELERVRLAMFWSRQDDAPLRIGECPAMLRARWVWVRVPGPAGAMRV